MPSDNEYLERSELIIKYLAIDKQISNADSAANEKIQQILSEFEVSATFKLKLAWQLTGEAIKDLDRLK